MNKVRNMYFLFKALHLIGMVVWFAGLFYMFRLFVYHRENFDKPDSVKMLKVMEYKLYYYITWPGMVGTVIFGSFLFINSTNEFSDLWIILKFSLIGVLISYHLYIGYTRKRFHKDDMFLTSKQCRIWNEAPTLLLVSIIFIAVYRHAL